MVTAYWYTLGLDPAGPTTCSGTGSSSARATAPRRCTRRWPRAGSSRAAELASFAQPLSPLNGHPNRVKVPGVEINTGPLGHGFPVATGCAWAPGPGNYRTIVVMGDGEMQEGSNWEAAMTAAHYGLDRLTAMVDRNRLQQGARTEDTKILEPFPEKWTSLGRRPGGSTATTTLPSSRRWGVHDRQARRDRRRHHQGQGRLVHGGPRRVAPQGAFSRSGPHRTRGALEHDGRTSARRPPHLGRRRRPPLTAGSTSRTSWPDWPCADHRIVAVCNDSVGSRNLTGFRDEFPDRLINVGIAEQDLVGVVQGWPTPAYPLSCVRPRRS